MELVFRIGIVVLLIFLNGYFVASEFALVAVRKTRISELAKKGNGSAKKVGKALNNINHYISATQLGVTLASLALGWVGEPVIARAIEPFFTFLPSGTALITSHTLAVIISFIVITFLTVVVGELVPKSIALQKTEKISFMIISPLLIFSKIFNPFIWLLNASGQLILRLFKFSTLPEAGSIHTEEEIKMLLEESSKGGAIPIREAEIVENVFEMGDIPVKAIMVPRTDILAFGVSTPLKTIVDKIADHPHSRFPVYENTIDTIIGFIHVKDIYRELLKKGEKVKLSQLNIIRKIVTVPEGKKIDSVLQEMRRRHIHLALVYDEFGGTAGIVTLEDVIESLVGEIEDEFDQPLQDIVKQKDGTFLVDGQTLIEDFKNKFKLSLKGQGYLTIGGLVVGLLGHDPNVRDSVQVNNLVMTIEQIEGKRVKLLKLRKEEKV